MRDAAARLLQPGTEAPGRVLVVVAHPDDEVLGCGALLARLPGVRVIHVTDGAPRNGADARRHGFADPQAYADARTAEAEAALALAGLPPTAITRLGIPDQEASLNLVPIARALRMPLAEADIVLTHAYEGGHSDHDAVAFAVAAAVRLAGCMSAPAVVEMPFYRAALASDPEGDGFGGWVRQRFLTDPAAAPEHLLDLDAGQVALKRAMMAAHCTQAGVLAGFPVVAERYRLASRQAFDALPHGGDLLYERHDWNLTGPLWLQRTAAARAELGWDAAP